VITLGDVEAAAVRIANAVRRTPMIQADQMQSLPIPAEASLWLKLECLQVTGSFKARGAMNQLRLLPPEALARGVITASGGNHGTAVARAAWIAGVSAVVYVPENVSAAKRAKLAGWGAEVRIAGRYWDEADVVARAAAEAEGRTYFHPFASPAIVAGQGTVALEILEQAPPMDIFLIAVGGGGLIAGMATVLKALQPRARIIGIEPPGSATLHDSLAAGEVVRLAEVTTTIPTLACGRTDPRIFEIARGAVEGVVLVEDAAMREAAAWLWFEFGIAADASGAAAVAALRQGLVDIRPGDRICALVCGAGTDGI
jgi:threonine dehydratase